MGCLQVKLMTTKFSGVFNIVLRVALNLPITVCVQITFTWWKDYFVMRRQAAKYTPLRRLCAFEKVALTPLRYRPSLWRTTYERTIMVWECLTFSCVVKIKAWQPKVGHNIREVHPVGWPSKSDMYMPKTNWHASGMSESVHRAPPIRLEMI